MKKFLTFTVMLVSTVCFSQSLVYMPDDEFENFAESNGWGDGVANNDYVDSASIAQVTGLVLSNKLISDYTGLEGFTSLTSFECANGSGQGIAPQSLSLLPFSNQLITFNSTGNPGLYCIEVADTAFANSNVSSGSWLIDPQASFSTDCNTAFGCLDSSACNWSPTHSIDVFAICNYDVVNNITENVCNEYVWNGMSYDTTGIYTNVFTAANGCDSTVILDLTVRYSSESTTILTVCDEYLWNGVVHDSSGTYEYFDINSVGCDSTAILVLTVNYSDATSSSEIACDEFIWDGVSYTSTGVYTNTYTNAAGCDSVHTLDLTINNSNTGLSVVTECDEFIWDGVTYDTTGIYTNTYTNAAGCDSVHTLDLTINNSNTGSSEVAECDEYVWDGVTYDTTGIYTNTYTNAAGCDSVHTLNLTISSSDATSSSVVECDSYTWDGVTYDTTGIYTNTYTNGAGCDSVHTLNLTINNAVSSVVNREECDSLQIDGSTYYTSGTFYYTIPKITDGCDSNITLNLTINYTDSIVLAVDSACDTYQWNVDNITYTTSALDTGFTQLTFNTTTAFGCDSSIYQNVYFGLRTTEFADTTVCEDFDWIVNGNVVGSVNQLGTDTLHFTTTNSMGCENFMSIAVTYNDPYLPINTTYDTLSCGPFVDFAGNVYNSSSAAQNIVVGITAQGCDFIEVVNLYVFDSTQTTSTSDVTACNEYTWPLNGTTYTSSTFDSVVIPTMYFAGTDSILCDSIVYLDLTINYSDTIIEDTIACDTYTWPLTGITYTSGGTYTWDTINNFGCDSVHVLNLTINSSDSTFDNVDACDSYIWDGITYDTSGVYTNSYTNQYGCDSTHTINLTVNSSYSDLDSNNSVISCDSYFWPVGNGGLGATYTTGGIKGSLLTGSNGCDSVLWIDITMEYSASYLDNQTICDEFIWDANGDGINNDTLYSSGNYTHYEFTPIAGCTLTYNLNLTINNSNTGLSVVTECDEFIWDGVTYDTTGIYTNTYTNVSGCDSVHTLDLTINNSNTGLSVVTECDEFTWDGVTYDSTGVYTNTYTNVSGCDSVHTLDLTIVNTNIITIFDTACHTYTWALASQNYDSTGVYPYVGNINACGDIDTVYLNLVVYERVFGSDNINACNSYDWNGTNYSTSGTYVDTLISATGCDSVATLNLTVNYNDTSYITNHNLLCDTLFIESDTLTSDGIHYVLSDTPTIHGCDSIIVVDLILNYTTYQYEAYTVCGEFYYYGDTITQSGTYITVVTDNDTLTCDTVIYTTVTVNPEYHNVIDTQVHCDSFTWINGITYTSSNNTARFDTVTVNGCDSIVYLDLTITNSNSGLSVVTECDEFIWDGVIYDSTGVYINTYTNVSGCDSVHTLDLTINNSNTGLSIVSACDEFIWDGVTYTSTGVYTNTYTNVSGCDSVHTLDLTINNNTGLSVVTACDEFIWDGLAYTSTGVYTNTYTNVSGCDSVHTLDLTINNSSTGLSVVTVCDEFVWDGVAYTSTGVYTNTYTNASGCDSVHTLDLTIDPLYSGDSTSTVITVCDEFTWDGVAYTSTGVYTNTYTNVSGCDSVHTLDLTVNNSNTGLSVVTVCDEFVWDGVTYTSTGVYTNTYTNVSGCDSVHTLDLTINNSSAGISVVAACDEFTWDGVAYTSTGVYTNTYTNVSGCDSVHTLDLTINNSNTGLSVVTSCDEFVWDGVIYDSTGVYTNTYTNAGGCDSVHTLDLTIDPSYLADSVTSTVVACGSYVWDGVTYNTSGIYTNTYTNASGCDSIHTLDLTIIEVSVVATQIAGSNSWEPTITGGIAPYTVTWTDPNGFTSNVSPLNPALSGWFSVFVTDDNGCISNIDSFEVSLQTEIVLIDIDKFNIYPNPTSDLVTVEFTANKISDYIIRVISTNGNEVFSKKLSNQGGSFKDIIDLSSYSKGNYLVEISNNESKVFKKLLVQ